MGTNYYAYENECKTCHRADELFHIGKASAGWKFLFKDNGMSYDATMRRIKAEKLIIKDEYGRKISIRAFKQMVEERQSLKRHETETNYGVTFITRQINGYDFAEGEFS